MDGKGFLLLDAGANMDAKPDAFTSLCNHGFNLCTSMCEKLNPPKIGLLNVGTEEGKGNELTKTVYELLKNAPIHFIGNIEARDFLDGVADVVITDGFSGNLVLKTLEGTGCRFVIAVENRELTSSVCRKIATAFLKNLC